MWDSYLVVVQGSKMLIVAGCNAANAICRDAGLNPWWNPWGAGSVLGKLAAEERGEANQE